MPFENLPDELKQLKQWIVWGKGKVPYNANTRELASVSDPSDWTTYDHAVAVSKDYLGIGFVFSDDDYYTGIDLDYTDNAKSVAFQLGLYKEFNSYSERSPSGRGLHIIVKGKVPGKGRRRSDVEMYSRGRFFTMTGDVFENHNEIKDCQIKLIQLYDLIGGPVKSGIYTGNDEETYKDDAIIEQATNAINGEKFLDLFKGNWQNYYPSQSEADYAIIDIIAFYTQNRNQIKRIFWLSDLGKRKKAKRTDYLDYMINKSFDRMLPPIDIDGLTNAMNDMIAAKENAANAGTLTALEVNSSSSNIDQITGASPFNTLDESASQNSVSTIATVNEHNHQNSLASSGFEVPPGMLGEVARFIYDAAVRPVPEIALAGAIGLMSGICGKAYNVSGTGLNQYVLLLAATGTGKEAIHSGISKLMSSIKTQVPTAHEFIGPEFINSGQALVKQLSTNQSFVSIIGEFDKSLKRWTSVYANSADVMLRDLLLKLYNRSGQLDKVGASAYSDKAKNIDAVEGVAFSILAETVPEGFYKVLDENMVTEGLLPRFMTIECSGYRPAMREARAKAPSMMLVEMMATLTAHTMALNKRGAVVDILLTAEAEQLSRQYDKLADTKINNSSREIIRHMWNRYHIKILKLAGLVAIGCDPYNPCITVEHLLWANKLVETDILRMLAKFEAGEIGEDNMETEQSNMVIKMMKEFIFTDLGKLKGYVSGEFVGKMHSARVVPYAYISRRLLNMAVFRKDRAGSTKSLIRAIQNVIDNDTIKELPKMQVEKRFGTVQRAFMFNLDGGV